MDSRLAWYAVGGSTTQLDAGSSSYSLLHSIYGSQVSQLPFSDYDSDASLIATTQSDYHVQPRASPTLKRRLSRPKSSPASVIAAREQLRSNPAQPVRPGSALPRQQRPGSAARRVVRGRPSSAAIGRPASAVASVVRGGASPSRRRPKTAMGFQRTPSLSGSSTVLLDLEEEEEGEDVAPIIRETAPVRLTHTPEYFDFWQGKPLRERDFGVKVHKRKPWRRPKSDYGTRFFNRNNKDKENDGRDGGRGDGSDGDGLGGLETLLEKEGDSSLSSRRGSRDFGTLGDGDRNKSGEDDSHRLSISGEGLGNSRRGSKDFGDRNKMGLRDRSTSSTRGRHKKTTDTDKQRGDKDSKGDDGLGSSRLRQSQWGDQDGTAAADDDDYFKNKALAAASWMDGGGDTSGNTTRFELPMDMRTLEGMTPLVYMNTHCVISKRRMAHCSKIFSKLDKRKTSSLSHKEVIQGLVQAHHNCVTEDQASSVLDVVQMDSEMTINSVKLFAAICCFAERMLNLFFLPLSKKEVIETVDFEALDWKLRNCCITESLRTLFSHL